MEIPVLRYLDILIGLAVVALLTSTIVASVTQLLLSSSYARSRNLRDGLADLISQVEPSLLSRKSQYIAERLLRHPLVARDNTPLGQVGWWLRSRFRGLRQGKLPLPPLNPPDAIQREELVMMLLEWAGEDGALMQQDRELAAAWPESDDPLKSLRDALRAALRSRGIGDAAGTAQNIRLGILRNEVANPGQRSQLWRLQAIANAAPADFVARLYAWFDNSMARIKQAYALKAKVVACIVAAVIVALIQVDGINLLRRLSTDDRLRASLLAEAQIQTKRMEDAQNDAQKASTDVAAAAKAGQTAQEAQRKLNDATKTSSDAGTERDKIATSLAALRDPSRDLVPSYFLWQAVAQASVCPNQLPARPVTLTGTIVSGTVRRSFRAELTATGTIEQLGAAIRDSGAPLAVYDDGSGCLRLVALSPSAGAVILQSSLGNSWSTDLKKQTDSFGFRTRLPGILLMWVLVSLGAPFWYDLLKKLLGFRSIVANKDDEERKVRQAEQTPPSTSPIASVPAQGSATVAGGTDERGDLSATGAEG